MRIDGPKTYNAVQGAGRGGRRADGSGAVFDLGGSSKPAETRAPSNAAPVGGLDALLALQMVEDPISRRRRGVKRGRSMLDALDDVKLSLLAGRVPGAQLLKLVASVEGRERDSEDPALESLLDEIELRARVELAKLEKQAESGSGLLPMSR